MPKAYNVMIDDEQRELLVDVLEEAGPRPEPEKEEERQLLVAMLRDLPKVEAENPGICHGLCL